MNFLKMFIVFAVSLSTLVYADPVSVATLVSNKTTTGVSTSAVLGGISRTYFVFGSTTAGSGACDLVIQVSNDNISFVDLATVSLVLGTSVVADGLASAAPWKYARGNISSISGTGAKCSLLVGSTGK